MYDESQRRGRRACGLHGSPVHAVVPRHHPQRRLWARPFRWNRPRPCTGQVTNITTSAPISGATVLFSYPVASGVTDSSGNFNLNVVQVAITANYRSLVFATANGYEEDTRYYQAPSQDFHLYPIHRIAAGDSTVVTRRAARHAVRQQVRLSRLGCGLYLPKRANRGPNRRRDDHRSLPLRARRFLVLKLKSPGPARGPVARNVLRTPPRFR